MKRFYLLGRTVLLVSVLLILCSLWGSSRAEPLFTGCSTVIVDATNADWEQEVVELVNAKRAENSLPPLKSNIDLSNAARYHMVDMVQDDYFEHDSYDRVSGALQQACAWYSRLRKFYSGGTLGENIAWGYPNPDGVMNGWMNSPGHQANILSSHYREIGVGYDNLYWGQDFGARSDVYPIIINSEAKQTESTSVQLYIYGDKWTEMRLRNDEEAWGSWQPFSNDLEWTLSAVAGERSVTVEMRNNTTSKSSSDTIDLLLVDTTPTDTFTPTPTATETPLPTPTETPTTTPVPSQLPTATFTPTTELQPPALLGRVTLQGRQAPPHSSWRQPLQVDFAPHDAENQAHSYTPVTDENGYFAIRDLPLGSFSIAIENEHSLRRVVEATINNSVVSIDAGELKEGDIVPDDEVNIFDFSLLANYYTHCIGNMTFLAKADLNDDLCIDDSDLALLINNFGQVSDPWSGGSLSAAAMLYDSANPQLEIAQISQQKAGDQIMLAVGLDGESSDFINAGAVYLNFDPAQIKAVSVQPTSPFVVSLMTRIDNEKGEADVAAGLLGTGVQAPFTIATVTFEALVDIESVPIMVAFDSGRRTNFAASGESTLPDPINSALQVKGETGPANRSLFLPFVTR